MSLFGVDGCSISCNGPGIEKLGAYFDELSNIEKGQWLLKSINPEDDGKRHVLVSKHRLLITREYIEYRETFSAEQAVLMYVGVNILFGSDLNLRPLTSKETADVASGFCEYLSKKHNVELPFGNPCGMTEFDYFLPTFKLEEW